MYAVALSLPAGSLAWQLPLAVLALVGHVALWTMLLNRVHAVGLPCRLVKTIQAFIFLIVPAAPLLWLVSFTRDGIFSAPQAAIVSVTAPNSAPVTIYVVACWAAALTVTVVWVLRRIPANHSVAPVSNHTWQVDVGAQLGHKPIDGWKTRLLASVPGNQFLRLDVNEKTIVVPNLPAALDGLSIAHVTDLHYTGGLTQDFYHCVVDETNRLDADLVAITGDIVDKSRCIDWIAPTLGRLRSRYGVYYVLGNHDKKLKDVDLLRKVMRQYEMVDLGGKWQTTEIRGQRVLLAGNEYPWFGPRPSAEDLTSVENGEDVFRLLLSHSPDQIGWAKRHGFDLMLAGHNHGGQIRFPLIGPIVSPSVYGVKYASGLFHEPPTMLHVCRGIAAMQAIRLNCPPELTKLVLKVS